MKILHRASRTRVLLITIGLLFLLFLLIQFIHPTTDNPPVMADFKAPANVKAIVQKACYDCHSNETNLRWYDKVAPVYWKVAADVKEGREGLNFSNWEKMEPADQKAKLWEAINQVYAGAMPIKSYQMVHPDTRISKEDLAILKAYVSGIAVSNKPDDTAKINAAAKQALEWQTGKLLVNKPSVALNGIAYNPDYKNWQALSTTERFDNNTMRVIFGNEIAVKAVKANNIHPWPNGTIFAKVAWDQLEDTNGNVKPGAFKQVEYMIKDDKKYAATEGWGFARFKTSRLVPYGKTILYTTECVNCHRPQKDEDFVFTQPIR